MIVPGRAPIGAHDDAGLIVVEPHHLAALAQIAGGIADRKIGRARGDRKPKLNNAMASRTRIRTCSDKSE